MFSDGTSTMVRKYGHILSSVTVTTSGRLLLTTRKEFVLYDPDNDTSECIYSLDLDDALRINDCKTAPDGRLIFSIFQDSKPRPRRGSIGIFGVNTDEVYFVLRDKLVTPNGIVPDSERNILWIADTGERKIYRYRLQAFLQCSDENSLDALDTINPTFNGETRPDGACIDIEGNYLVALLEGAALLKVNATTLESEFLPLPIANPTMCSFYGGQLGQMLVTCRVSEQNGAGLFAPIAYSGRGQMNFLFNDGIN